MAMGKIFRVFHKLPPDPDTPYSVILESKNREETVMFESNAVVVLSSAEADTVKKNYSKILDAYACLGVLNLNAGNQKILYLVLVTTCLSVGKIGDTEVFKITAVQLVPLRNEPSDEERVVEVRKLLSSGTFYFSWCQSGIPWDLSLCAQRKHQDHETDNRFFWNRLLHVHLKRYGIDCDQWLIKIMCGAVEIRTIYAAHRQAKACLISRLSCERAGTRFNVRGTNDDGHVANFVETEQVIFLDEQVSSFVETRGSVPLFWEQPGINVGAHKVHMSRGYETSAPAYDRHLQMIRKHYGEQVIINLLGSKEGERLLSQAFQNHHKASSHHDIVPFIHFDYHAEIKGSNLKNLDKLKTILLKKLKEFDFFASDGSNILRQQTGTMRTNCLDCLDRTNAVQTMVAMEILPAQVESLGLSNKPQMLSRFQEVYKQIWALNGDHVSRIYAGTGALGGGRSKISDASRSASRAIQNNFLDNTKQESIDILLVGNTLLGELTDKARSLLTTRSLHGELTDKARSLLTTRSLHATPGIIHGMINRYKEYTEPKTLRIGVCTWNVNGGKHFRSIAYKHQSLTDWLLDAHKTVAMARPEDLLEDTDYNIPVDIFAIGFEEIVDLNASNIMKASTTNAQDWQKELIKTISRDHKYVVLNSIQLVGVVLYVFIRPQLAPFVRYILGSNIVSLADFTKDVAVEKVKTGLGGATGNKGGVAIRFLIHSTSVCFVCAHLAAGQSQVHDRNADYAEIMRRMAFPMGRTIQSHDYVFWCGDFNYRIDLPGDEVKELVKNENFGALQACDQLNKERAEGRTFQGFNEGVTNFPPTYKYDLFSDDFDTSEKCRAPAWTDRVLWRRRHILPQEAEEEDPDWNPGKLILYTRAELRTSDHRPVIGLFDIEVLSVDESAKEKIFQEVIGEQGPPDGTVIISMETEMSDDTVNEIVELFNEVGEIIVVRFVGNDMWVIYRNGQHAIEALKYDNHQLSSGALSVRLKTEGWRQVIEDEMKLCALNTEAMFNVFTNSLLGDDFSVPSMEFSMEEDDEEELGETLSAADVILSRSNTPVSGRSSPAVSDDGVLEIPGGPPSRPLPPSRPAAAPNTKPTAPANGQQLIVPEKVNRVSSPSPELSRKKPPERPSAPPARPSPPQRPPGGPPRPAPTSKPAPGAPNRPSAGPPKIRQPLRPPPKNKKNPKVTSIGLPTNVSHHGHAASEDEARQLIEKLMAGSGSGSSLPAPPSQTGLAPNTTKPVPRSRTSEFFVNGTENQNDPAPVPKQRFRSMENLVSESQADKDASVSIPAPIAAPTSDIARAPVTAPTPIARPRPTPRRSSLHNENVQNIPDPQPAAGSGPPKPPPRPSSAVDFTKMAENSDLVPEAKPRNSFAANSQNCTMYGSQNLLDEPLPTVPASPDPFDTSSIPSYFMNKAPPPIPAEPLVPTSSPVLPMLTSIPPMPVDNPPPPVPKRDESSSSPLVCDVNTESSEPPPFSPPPVCPDISPPPPPNTMCPSEPPPPPPRTDASVFDHEPSPPIPDIAPPPVPTRSSLSPLDAPQAPKPGPPPLPSRPAPPPVPPR